MCVRVCEEKTTEPVNYYRTDHQMHSGMLGVHKALYTVGTRHTEQNAHGTEPPSF